MKLVKVFRSLAERNRLRIILLLEPGPLNVSELVEITGLSQSNISHHLRVLLEAGVVQRSGRGNWAFYSLETDNGTVSSILGAVFFHGAEVSNSDDMKLLADCYARRKEHSRVFFDSMAEEEWEHLTDTMPDTMACLPFLDTHLKERLRTVEVGAGTGTMIPYLLSRSKRVTAVDSSKTMLDHARKAMRDAGMEERVDLRLGEAEHLPVGDRAADAVFMHMVLHHCGDPAQALREAERVLQTTGVLLLVDLVEHDKPGFRDRHGDLWPGFTAARLEKYAADAGFAPIELKRYDKEGVIAMAAVKGAD
jgi:SAM-dependent methyltransferase